MKFLLLLLFSLSAFGQQARYFDEWRSQSSNDYVTIKKSATYLGDGTNAVDKCFYANNGDASEPYICYDESEDKWSAGHDGVTNFILGAGGQGGINHIENYNYEDSVDDWVEYADAAGVIPVNGDGGTANVSFTKSSSEPLRGTASGLLTKDAADRQGQGVTNLLSIEEADTENIVRVSFKYTSSADYDDADMGVYLYDMNAASLVRAISGEDIYAASNKEHVAYFQTSANTSYRLILHVQSTNADAYTLKIDDVKLGPISDKGVGAFSSDTVASTCASTWVSNATVSCFYSRHGDKARVFVHVLLTGTPTTASLGVDLPTGLISDTAKISGTINRTHVGNGYIIDTGTEEYPVTVLLSDSGSVRVLAEETTTGSELNAVTQAFPIAFANTDEISFSYEVPISGWETGIKPNEILSGKLHTLSVFGSGAVAMTNATQTKLTNWGTPIVDESAMWDSINNKVVFKESGNYQISAQSRTYQADNDSTRFIISIYKNGSAIAKGGSQASSGVSILSDRINKILPMVAGDYIEIYVYQQNTSTGSASGTSLEDHQWLDVTRLSPLSSAIQPTEKIAFFASSDNGQTVIANAPVIFEDVDPEHNTHSAYDSSTGIFTMPGVTRWCTIHANAETTSATKAFSIEINGSGVALGFNASTDNSNVNTSTAYLLHPGDTVEIANVVGASRTMSTNGTRNTFSILCN